MTAHGASARDEARLVEIAERDEVVRSFFGGRIRVTRWRDKRGLRYSLIVGDRVETIGAWSERDAVAHARAHRRFVEERDNSASSGHDATARADEAQRRLFENVPPGATLKYEVPIIEHGMWGSREVVRVEVLVEVLAVGDGTVTFAVVGTSGAGDGQP
jgi:hypothetical protein